MAKMLNQSAAKIFMVLIAGLAVGQSRKIDNTHGTYMPVSVERLGENRYSVTHYFEQNGDLVPDPDMEFMTLEAGGNVAVIPLAIQHSTGHYQRTAELDDNGKIKGFYVRALAEQVSFANTWMRNIRLQQGLKA